MYSETTSLWGETLNDFLRAMFNIGTAWKPSHNNDEPPF